MGSEQPLLKEHDSGTRTSGTDTGTALPDQHRSRFSLAYEVSMPRFFFDLFDGVKTIPDPEGMELSDALSARAHGFDVIRELARNREDRTSGWRLSVHQGPGMPRFEMAFASAVSRTASKYRQRCA